jgi:hypothetical protein
MDSLGARGFRGLNFNPPPIPLIPNKLLGRRCDLGRRHYIAYHTVASRHSSVDATIDPDMVVPRRHVGVGYLFSIAANKKQDNTYIKY